MRNGEVVDVIKSTGSEDKAIKLVQDLNERLSVIRERLRNGDIIGEATL